jgi:hypothetical protein
VYNTTRRIGFSNRLNHRENNQLSGQTIVSAGWIALATGSKMQYGTPLLTSGQLDLF